MNLEKDVAQDYYKAVELYRKGCNAGNALGCTDLDISYEKGQRRKCRSINKQLDI